MAKKLDVAIFPLLKTLPVSLSTFKMESPAKQYRFPFTKIGELTAPEPNPSPTLTAHVRYRFFSLILFLMLLSPKQYIQAPLHMPPVRLSKHLFCSKLYKPYLFFSYHIPIRKNKLFPIVYFSSFSILYCN